MDHNILLNICSALCYHLCSSFHTQPNLCMSGFLSFTHLKVPIVLQIIDSKAWPRSCSLYKCQKSFPCQCFSFLFIALSILSVCFSDAFIFYRGRRLRFLRETSYNFIVRISIIIVWRIIFFLVRHLLCKQ